MGASNNGTTGFLNDQLSKKTSIFGLRLWVVIGIGVGAFIVLILFFLSIWLTSRRKSKRLPEKVQSTLIPMISKEIQEVKVDALGDNNPGRKDSGDRDMEKGVVHVGYGPLSKPTSETDRGSSEGELGSNGKPSDRQSLLQQDGAVVVDGSRYRQRRPSLVEEGNEIGVAMDGDQNQRIVSPAYRGLGSSDKASNASGETGRSSESPAPSVPEVSHLGWGHWYILRDLEIATNCFSDANVIGEGGYGIVYRGVLPNGTHIAVKNLLNNRGQAEKEFRVEVEAIGRVRHKNLVRLIGYCAEGAHRMLVYEFVDNGNLEQWLHGDVGSVSPLTWDIRMKIILGTAKGLAYLHEGLEPKVVHRDVKSSNILLDRQWNAKVSDFGLAKLLGSEKSYVTTRVMGTFGYVAPEYASTGMLNERSDVYSFGVLLMEIISGRNPVDYGRPAGEVNLVDWLKMMVGNRRSDEVIDPLLEAKPSARALKRALLVSLRCVDPDAQKRPKMGHVIHMLEADEFPFRDDRRIGREAARARREGLDQDRNSKPTTGKGNADMDGSDGDREIGSPSHKTSERKRRLLNPTPSSDHGAQPYFVLPFLLCKMQKAFLDLVEVARISCYWATSAVGIITCSPLHGSALFPLEQETYGLHCLINLMKTRSSRQRKMTVQGRHDIWRRPPFCLIAAGEHFFFLNFLLEVGLLNKLGNFWKLGLGFKINKFSLINFRKWQCTRVLEIIFHC